MQLLGPRDFSRNGAAVFLALPPGGFAVYG